ncbi:GIY-YIG nuclease family protein [Candidatus Daviesbacteria bacterium]|nr:GIY-YIG nuclease family protein [Candidatus Daviesbacteria bacterium]
MKTSYYHIDYINQLPTFSGIYWLFESSNGILNLVYLGKSRNIRQRLRDHSQSKSHRFDFFTYEFYPERKLRKKCYQIINKDSNIYLDTINN